MTNKKFALVAILAAAAQFATISTANAADPLANCADGVPFLWPNGGTNIPFNPDQGGLGPLDNAGAIAQVATSFQAWEDIGLSTATYTNAGILGLDVDITNFGPFLNATAPDGLSAIVFDDSGEIFELLFGAGTGVLGFAGPEFVDPANCEILEGLSFLNGPSFVNMDDPTDFTAATDVMVHEFGHYSNLAHVQINGAIGLGDFDGPGANVFGFEFGLFFTDIIETMYPFYFGPAVGTQTPAADDVSSLSELYPEANYSSSTASISGSVLAPNGTTRISGVNVIARNLADPFADAVSAISGGETDQTDPNASDVVGTFTITGLTPGADYAVFIDDLGITTSQGGAFSTGATTPLPGPEEFWNGDAEASDPLVDDPLAFAAVSGNGGDVSGGVDVILNAPQPGQPLEVGDDGAVQIFLDFPFDFCGVRHDSLFVNANGDISFIAPNNDASESTPEFLSGAPRIAGLWNDLNADPASCEINSGLCGAGTVTFNKTDYSFTAIWDGVPQFGSAEPNSFEITLYKKGPWLSYFGVKKGNLFSVKYGDVAASNGIAGYSCGANGTSGFESETVNLKKRHFWWTDWRQPGTRFEQFTDNGAGSEVVNLAHRKIAYSGANQLRDSYERKETGWARRYNRNNDSIDTATHIRLPFDSSKRVTTIAPDGDDIDFYRFKGKAGEVIAAEVVRTHNDNLNLGLDTVIGLFNADTGELLAVDDDGGYLGGLGFAGLSRLIIQLNEDTNLALAVTTFPDTSFEGAGGLGGRYVVSVRSYPEPDFVLSFPDESSFEIPLPNGFKFQGEEWDSVFINSNGHLTFGQENALSFFPNVLDLLNGPPRIAPLWDDFEPDGLLGGSVPGLVLVDSDSNSTSVHWVSVGQFIPTGPSYFSVEMKKNGKVEMDIGATTRELNAFGAFGASTIVGISEGGGAVDPGSTDLSKAHKLNVNGTTYEEFGFPGAITPSTFDLFFDSLRFSKSRKDEDD
ncbi:MAG: hypothetical protein ACR2QT_04765 [Woeseiaceae bacterium]